MDVGVATQSLQVYSRTQRVKQVEDPASWLVLDWLNQLDGEQVTDLVLTCAHGWLTVGVFDDDLTICTSDWSFAECQSEIVSRQVAADHLLTLLARQQIA